MTEKKYACLTFDDGPTIGITDQILDLLEQYNILASFFIIADYVNDDNKYLMKRAYDMGCTLENHSKTHSVMPELSAEQIEYEIKYTSDLVEEIVGERPKFFRPPFIAYDQKMYDHIELPFICGYGCEDWVPEVTAQERYEKIMESANPGYMILVHDMENNQNTVDALKRAIPELIQQGYEFVTVRELFEKCGVTPQRNVTYMGVNETRQD